MGISFVYLILCVVMIALTFYRDLTLTFDRDAVGFVDLGRVVRTYRRIFAPAEYKQVRGDVFLAADNDPNELTTFAPFSKSSSELEDKIGGVISGPPGMWKNGPEVVTIVWTLSEGDVLTYDSEDLLGDYLFEQPELKRRNISSLSEQMIAAITPNFRTQLHYLHSDIQMYQGLSFYEFAGHTSESSITTGDGVVKVLGLARSNHGYLLLRASGYYTGSTAALVPTADLIGIPTKDLVDKLHFTDMSIYHVGVALSGVARILLGAITLLLGFVLWALLGSFIKNCKSTVAHASLQESVNIFVLQLVASIYLILGFALPDQDILLCTGSSAAYGITTKHIRFIIDLLGKILLGSLFSGIILRYSRTRHGLSKWVITPRQASMELLAIASVVGVSGFLEYYFDNRTMSMQLHLVLFTFIAIVAVFVTRATSCQIILWKGHRDNCIDRLSAMTMLGALDYYTTAEYAYIVDDLVGRRTHVPLIQLTGSETLRWIKFLLRDFSSDDVTRMNCSRMQTHEAGMFGLPLTIVKDCIHLERTKAGGVEVWSGTGSIKPLHKYFVGCTSWFHVLNKREAYNMHRLPPSQKQLMQEKME